MRLWAIFGASAPCPPRSMGCLRRSMGCFQRSMGCLRRSMGCCRGGKACIFLFVRLCFSTTRPVVRRNRPAGPAQRPCSGLTKKRNGQRTGDFGGQGAAVSERGRAVFSFRVGKKLNGASGCRCLGAAKTLGGHFLAPRRPLVSFSVGRPLLRSAGSPGGARRALPTRRGGNGRWPRPAAGSRQRGACGRFFAGAALVY